MWRHMQHIISVIVWSVPTIFIITIIIIHHIAITITCAFITLTFSLLTRCIKGQGHLITIFMNHTQDLEFLFLNEFLSSPRETRDSGFCLNGLPSTQLFMRIRLNVPMYFPIIYHCIIFVYLIMRCTLTEMFDVFMFYFAQCIVS